MSWAADGANRNDQTLLGPTLAAAQGALRGRRCCQKPCCRGKSGWKWSLLCDRAGIPVSWAADGANRNDQTLLGPTLAAAGRRGLLADARPCTWTAATPGTRC